MSLPSNRRREPGGVDTGGIAVLVGVGAVAAVAGAVWLAVRVAYSWADWEWPDLGFFEIVLGVASGRVPWPPAATGLLIGLLTAVAVLAALAWLLLSRGSRKSTRVDRTAGVLGRGKEVSTVSRRTVEQTAKRLGVAQSPGVMIGRTVADGQMLYGSWEDMHVDIWGPRTGKTTSRAVPAVLDAPGAVLATSNKRDLVDASRDPRAQNGPVWVFDPQGIALEPATWWWNPLSYVTDEVKAAKLAEHFASGSRDAGARTDAYFDPAGQDLLAGLLLAGALDRRPITDVYRWLTRPTDDTAVDILRNHGYTLSADQVSGVIDAPDKQRGGVYGTAQQMASCLTNRQVLEWVTPRGPAGPWDRRAPRHRTHGGGGRGGGREGRPVAWWPPRDPPRSGPR